MSRKLTLDEFIEKSKEKHGDRYDYSLSEYKNSRTKLIIVCDEHGEFLQTPVDHYLSGCGCPKCDPTSNLGNEKFIERSKEKHGDRYDYSKVVYGKNNYEKVVIICKQHGEFEQVPWAHLRGQGCPDCANNKRSNNEEFIVKSIKKHGDRYDYSLVDYVSKNVKVKIICHKHGVFKQKPSVHLRGHGCSVCNNSKLESYFRKKLIEFKIGFESNKRFETCRNKLPLPFDFFIKEKNILVELDGIQHRKPIEYFGGKKRFEYQKKNDSIKDDWCVENRIILFRLTNFKQIDSFFNDIM